MRNISAVGVVIWVSGGFRLILLVSIISVGFDGGHIRIGSRIIYPVAQFWEPMLKSLSKMGKVSSATVREAEPYMCTS